MSARNPKNEKDVKDAIKQLCKRAGAYYAMPHQAGYGVAGVPDLLICHRGEFIAIEAKFNKRPATSHQKDQLRQIKAAGGRAMIIDESGLTKVAAILGISY